MSTYSVAAELDSFNDCLDELAIELVKEDLDVESAGYQLGDFHNPNEEGPIEEQIQKSAWVASLLASSDDDDHRRKALAFGILSYIRYQDGENEPIYRRYLYIILSRLGNLPAFNNVDQTESEITFEQQLVQSLDSILSTELVNTRQNHEIEGGKILSRFQKEIYEHLLEGRDVAISGPTSSGKSFILRQYIDDQIASEGSFEAIYVVPTRALISEVSRKLTERHEEITVRTGAYFEDEDEDGEDEDHEEENVFLVVTPERCRKLLDPEVQTKINPDLVFFDEVQNVEDNERGVLFEGTVQSLNELYPSAQIVAAGPYLDNPGDTLESLTDNEVAEVQTAFTPVLQLKVTLRFTAADNNDILVNIHSPSGILRSIHVPEPENLTYSEVKQNKSRSLPAILSEFGDKSKNLVYSGQKNYAEKRAKLIAESNEKRSLSPKIEELKEFLAKSIHKEYSLIDCLDQGVAFHHGNVPKIAREEIEEIYRTTGDLETIVTTPTLMQGVNLPAEKIFLVGARRGSKDLTDFEFNNLIGRVGRVDTKLYGAIYCIETDDDEWADEKLDNAGEKEVEPATSQAINDSELLLEALKSRDLSSVSDASVKYTAILLRGKYIKQGKSVDEYLEKKGMDSLERKEVREALESTVGDVDIPEEILRKNPTVDPVNLETLYNVVEKNPDKWILGEERYEDLYNPLLKITRNLNKIFKFTNDSEANIHPDHRETEFGGLTPIIVYATQWLQGQSYQDMIAKRQEFEKENTHSSDEVETIDESIRNVMKIVDNDICFLLVKYFGILTTVLEHVDTDTSDWMLQFDRMLEMGSMNFAELKLMSKGVDRSVAVDLALPMNVDDPVKYLKENRGRVPGFYERHLEKQGVL